jgi:tetratricopeptide (TPR) repeat protein
MSPKPMLIDDYLIRQINLALAALASIIGLKTAGLYQNALFEIDQFLEQLLGLRSYMIKDLSDEAILTLISVPEGLDTDRLFIIAELIKAEGDIYAAQNYVADSQLDYLRSLNFFIEVVLNGGAISFPQPHDKIENLVKVLDFSKLPQETIYDLFQYYEHVGNYIKAEEALNQLTKLSGSDESILQEHTEFYVRLQSISDKELAKAGLSRAQVEDRLEILRHATQEGLIGCDDD